MPEATQEKTGLGNYFVANYPPFSAWKPAYLSEAHSALASAPEPDTPLGLYRQLAVLQRAGRLLCSRASFFNLFNNVRRQTLNTAVTYKMKGGQLSDGYSIFNSPEQLQANLKASNPNASAAELYNQYRQGFGSTNITTVLDPRRIEIGMRFKF